MAGMLFAGSKIFTSIGIGAMLVVFTSLVGSLTVLPALLGKLGDRIERGVSSGRSRPALLRVSAPLAEPRWLVWLRDTPTLLQRVKGDRQESRLWACDPAPVDALPGARGRALDGASSSLLALPVTRHAHEAA